MNLVDNIEELASDTSVQKPQISEEELQVLQGFSSAINDKTYTLGVLELRKVEITREIQAVEGKLNQYTISLAEKYQIPTGSAWTVNTNTREISVPKKEGK